MTTAPPTEHELYIARQRVEERLAAAQTAERERIERENAARREIENAQAELARLTRLQLAATLEHTVEDAHAMSATAATHTDALKAAAAAVVGALMAFATGPLVECEHDAELAKKANQTALAAAADLHNAQPPAPDRGESDINREFAQRQAYDSAILTAFERLPAPILPWAVVLEMLHTETDELRRRALGALFYMATGQTPPHTGEGYTAADESRRYERNRIRRYTFIGRELTL